MTEDVIKKNILFKIDRENGIDIPNKWTTINSLDNYKLLNVLDIDWNAMRLTETDDIKFWGDWLTENKWGNGLEINDTPEMMNVVNYMLSRIKYLDREVEKLLHPGMNIIQGSYKINSNYNKNNIFTIMLDPLSEGLEINQANITNDYYVYYLTNHDGDPALTKFTLPENQQLALVTVDNNKTNVLKESIHSSTIQYYPTFTLYPGELNDDAYHINDVWSTFIVIELPTTESFSACSEPLYINILKNTNDISIIPTEIYGYDKHGNVDKSNNIKFDITNNEYVINNKFPIEFKCYTKYNDSTAFTDDEYIQIPLYEHLDYNEQYYIYHEYFDNIKHEFIRTYEPVIFDEAMSNRHNLYIKNEEAYKIQYEILNIKQPANSNVSKVGTLEQTGVNMFKFTPNPNTADHTYFDIRLYINETRRCKGCEATYRFHMNNIYDITIKYSENNDIQGSTDRYDSNAFYPEFFVDDELYAGKFEENTRIFSQLTYNEKRTKFTLCNSSNGLDANFGTGLITTLNHPDFGSLTEEERISHPPRIGQNTRIEFDGTDEEIERWQKYVTLNKTPDINIWGWSLGITILQSSYRNSEDPDDFNNEVIKDQEYYLTKENSNAIDSKYYDVIKIKLKLDENLNGQTPLFFESYAKCNFIIKRTDGTTSLTARDNKGGYKDERGYYVFYIETDKVYHINDMFYLNSTNWIGTNNNGTYITSSQDILQNVDNIYDTIFNRVNFMTPNIAIGGDILNFYVDKNGDPIDKQIGYFKVVEENVDTLQDPIVVIKCNVEGSQNYLPTDSIDANSICQICIANKENTLVVRGYVYRYISAAEYTAYKNDPEHKNNVYSDYIIPGGLGSCYMYKYQIDLDKDIYIYGTWDVISFEYDESSKNNLKDIRVSSIKEDGFGTISSNNIENQQLYSKVKPNVQAVDKYSYKLIDSDYKIKIYQEAGKGRLGKEGIKKFEKIITIHTSTTYKDQYNNTFQDINTPEENVQVLSLNDDLTLNTDIPEGSTIEYVDKNDNDINVQNITI